MQLQIPLFKICWDQKDIKMVKDAIQKGMFWAIGPNVERFEKMLGEYIGARFVVAFNSGTSALHAILFSYGIRQGDEVIVPSFTFIATANAPLFVGAKPVFADIEEETFGLSPESIREKITKNTKAIIAVHYGGCPCKIKEIKKIAKEYNLLLIEDAAEAFGAEVYRKKVGTFGEGAMFSFCQNKIITTGEGGCAVTDSRKIYERLKLIRSHGEIKNKDFHQDHITLGFNFRMSNITASLGLSQLEKVERNIKMRGNITRYMTEKIKTIKEVKLPQVIFNPFNVYQMYPIMVHEGLRDELMDYLGEKGIATKIYFYPVHLSTLYRRKLGYREGIPVTESISRKILSLPIYPTLKREEADYIVEKIREFFQKMKKSEDTNENQIDEKQRGV